LTFGLTAGSIFLQLRHNYTIVIANIKETMIGLKRGHTDDNSSTSDSAQKRVKPSSGSSFHVIENGSREIPFGTYPADPDLVDYLYRGFSGGTPLINFINLKAAKLYEQVRVGSVLFTCLMLRTSKTFEWRILFSGVHSLLISGDVTAKFLVHCSANLSPQIRVSPQGTRHMHGDSSLTTIT
jgi:hypothetical protein